jgi:hypothetical protein
MEDETMLRETIRRLKATGIAVADLEVVAFRPETEIGVFSTLFDAAAELGAKHVLVACSPIASHDSAKLRSATG